MTSQRIIPSDEPVRKQIRTELDGSMVIEAGAGTGKTTLLIDRMIALLHKFDISEVVAITFTEKAAAELSERLYTELEKQGNEKPERHPLHLALNRFDHANISTIHAFASSIIRERPIEAGIDPEFSSIEPEEEKELLRQLVTEDLTKPDRKRDDILTTFRSLGGSLNQVMELLEKLFDHRDLLGLLSLNSTPSDFTGEVKRFSGKVDDLLSYCMDHCENDRDSMHKKLKGLRSDLPVTDDDIILWLGGWKTFSYKKGNKTKWDSADALANVREELRELIDSVDSLVKTVRTETLESVIRWLIDIINHAGRVKSERGQLGYQDLLIKTRKLLERPHLLQHFQDKYKRILIDEFQDTDPLQVEIAMMLCQQSPENKMLEPGKLCIVGDPKQSIYRFRRADPRVYKSATEDILQTGNKRLVTQNFRSAVGIVNFVNRFFSSIWRKDSDAISGYVPIDPLISRPELMPTPSVTVLTPYKELVGSMGDASSVRSNESKAIAASIRTAVDSWQILAGERKRPAEFGDMAILFPTTTDLDTYKNSLTDAGIPFQVEAGKKFYRSQMVTDLYNCLRAIDNPMDRLAVIGALRSVLLGVSDVDLTGWLSEAGDIADYRIESADSTSTLADSLKLLRKMHGMRKELTPDQLIEELLQRTEIIPVLSADPYGYSDISTISRIIDLARIYCSDHEPSLRGFLRWLSSRMDKADEKNSGDFDDSNRVKLITVHSAKGLEFPILYLANLSVRPKLKVESIPDRIGGKFEIAIGPQVNRFETAGFQSSLQAEHKILQEEHFRLFYVALTRARDHLVLPLFYGKKPEGYSKWLTDFVDAATDSEDEPLFKLVESTHYQPERTKTDLPLKFDPTRVRREKQTWEQERTKRIEEVQDSLPRLISPSFHGTGEDTVINVKAADGLSLAGSVGRAVHRYMAVCSVDDTVNLDLIKYVCSEENVEVDDVIQHTNNCLNSEIWKDASQSKRMWREVPVSVKTEEGLVRGSVDIMWEAKNGDIFIADWKTGAYDPKRHENQIMQYATAITISTESCIKEGYLYFTKECRTVEVSLD